MGFVLGGRYFGAAIQAATTATHRQLQGIYGLPGNINVRALGLVLILGGFCEQYWFVLGDISDMCCVILFAFGLTSLLLLISRI